MYKQIVLFLCIVLCSIHLTAQCSSCTYNDCMVSNDKEWLLKNGYTLADTYSYSVIPGMYAFTWRTLYNDTDYVVLTRSESGVTDLDLWLYDSDGSTELASQTTSDDNGFAYITYQPSYQRSMKIMVKNHSARCSTCSYRVCAFVFIRARTR